MLSVWTRDGGRGTGDTGRGTRDCETRDARRETEDRGRRTRDCETRDAGVVSPRRFASLTHFVSSKCSAFSVANLRFARNEAIQKTIREIRNEVAQFNSS